MSFITLDWETYWADDYSLTKMTTEEYIRDPRFQVIGVGIKIDDGPSKWFSGTHGEIKQHLLAIDWANSAMLCHHTMFDAAILAWHFGIVPAFYYDTLSMSRALHGVEVRGSLKALAEMYNIGVKGEEVFSAKNKRLEDFSPYDLAQYGAYCCNDCDLTFSLFHCMAGAFPDDEFQLIDLTLRMFTEPVLEVDNALLIERLKDIEQEKSALLGGLMHMMQVDTEEKVRKQLASGPKFAKVLESYGIEPPMKLSAKTGKMAYAFAKTDESFIALQECEIEEVQILCAARLGTKSTIEEGRITRFISIGGRNKGKLPIPLKYYAAHTGRWGGTDAINLQNLPTRDKKKKTLKNSLVAPEDHTIINSDSSQIEARVLAWLAGQDDIVEAFAQKRDVYCEDASKAFGRTITKADEMERFCGKTMRLGLGFGTGAVKLQSTFKTSPMKLDLDINLCKKFVRVFRAENSRIVDLWSEADMVLSDLASWPEGKLPYYFGQHKCVIVCPDGLHLPNGLVIRYKELRLHTSPTNRTGWVHDTRKGTVSIWGGTVVENVVQALARIIVGQQMLKIKEKHKIALTVHDAAVCVVPDSQLEYALPFIEGIMGSTVPWAPGLPVACEVSYGKSYGDCRTAAQWAKAA